MSCKPVHFTLCPKGTRHRVTWKVDPIDKRKLVGYCDDCLAVFEVICDNDRLAETVLSLFKTLRSDNVDLEEIIVKKLNFFSRLFWKHKVNVNDKLVDTYIFPKSTKEFNTNLDVIHTDDIIKYTLKSYTHFTNLGQVISWLDILDTNLSSNIPNRTKELLEIVSIVDPKLLIEVLDVIDYLTKVEHIKMHGNQILQILHKINKYMEEKLEKIRSQKESDQTDSEETLIDRLKDIIAINIALNKVNNMEVG